MAFRYTPTPTPSITPTKSLTPSITPSFTPTQTVCPCVCTNFIATSYNATFGPIAVSNTGQFWSASTSAQTQFGTYEFAVKSGFGQVGSASRFVALGVGSGFPNQPKRTFYSDDNGNTWNSGTTLSTSGMIDDNGKSIFVNNKFFMASRDVITSSDGINWTTSLVFTGTASSVPFVDLATNGLRVVVTRPASSTPPVDTFFYTDDFGMTWNQTATVPPLIYREIDYRNGRWFAVDDIRSAVGIYPERNAITSTDGINWTSLKIGTGTTRPNLYSIGSNDTMWIIGAQKDTNVPAMFYSYDGVNWISNFSSAFSGVNRITDIQYNFVSNTWVAIGAKQGGNNIFYSNDGVNWIVASYPNNLISVSTSLTTCCSPKIPLPSPTPSSTPTLTPTLTPTITSTPSSTPPIVSYMYAGGASQWGTSTLACSNKTCARPYFKSVPSWAVGTVVYDDNALTVPTNGNGLWIVVDTSTGTFCSGLAWAAVRVDTNGVILDFISCP